MLNRLAEASDELRKHQRSCEEERDRERSLRRSGSNGSSMRRAASTDTDTPDMPRHSRVVRQSPSNGSLYRKSLSLDHSTMMQQQQMADQQQQGIWKVDDGSMSSMQSIDSEFGGGMVRDNSMDSRLSGGSTQSDMPRGARKKKPRGLMGKLRSLTGTGAKTSRVADSEGSVSGRCEVEITDVFVDRFKFPPADARLRLGCQHRQRLSLQQGQFEGTPVGHVRQALQFEHARAQYRSFVQQR